MLTILHKEKSGHQSLQSAKSVSFNPGSTDTETSVDAFGCSGEGGAVVNGYCRYGNGSIYVMNDTGATVAVYDLD
jgi:hypothetical protein